jgi:hypothetical protein
LFEEGKRRAREDEQEDDLSGLDKLVVLSVSERIMLLPAQREYEDAARYLEAQKG